MYIRKRGRRFQTTIKKHDVIMASNSYRSACKQLVILSCAMMKRIHTVFTQSGVSDREITQALAVGSFNSAAPCTKQWLSVIGGPFSLYHSVDLSCGLSWERVKLSVLREASFTAGSMTSFSGMPFTPQTCGPLQRRIQHNIIYCSVVQCHLDFLWHRNRRILHLLHPITCK